jgi:hypothetical protein
MANTWTGDGLSQNDFMIKDECILVDFHDTVIGHASKLDCHIFSEKNVCIS